MNGFGFSPKTVVMLAAAAAGLFAVSILLRAYESPGMDPNTRSGPGTHSTSALGHAALYGMMARMGRAVARTAGDPRDFPDGDGLLVVAEPDMRRVSGSLAADIAAAPNLLLVLPKWRGEHNPARPAWIREAEPLPLAPVLTALHLAESSADVVRCDWPSAWTVNSLEVEPSGTGTAQLLRPDDDLLPLVATDAGILVGQLWRDDRRILVLSDPDVMANHGLGRGDNALFMLALFDNAMWGDRDAPVVFDEAIHGVRRRGERESPLRLLFEFPFVVATLLACCAAAIIVLAGSGRFGPAARVRAERGFGKEGLIENSVRLMRHSGHQAEMLRRYARMTVDDAAGRLRAPSGLDGREREAWLDRLGKARGVELSCGDIMRRVLAVGDGPEDVRRLMRCADEIYRWRVAISREYR